MKKDLNEKNGLKDGEELKTAEKPEGISASDDSAPGQSGATVKVGKISLSKQALIRIIAIAAAAVVAVVALTLGLVLGLKKNDGVKEYTVEFRAADHVAYSVTDFSEITSSGKITVAEGTQVYFSLIIDEDFDSPVVTANTVALSASEGVYSITVTMDTVVSVSGLVDNSVQLSGTGAKETPFIINDLRELNYVAAQVNRGVAAYVIGYYSLAADIDCGGEYLNIIGDASTASSFFAGCFDGNNHTISNYKISSAGNPYVGLFGMVQQYVSSSSAVDDNSGVIKNLHLKNFDVFAHAPDGSNVIAGSIAGYGMAAKILNCSAVNGTVTVLGNNYFSYSGGAVGILQSGTNSGVDTDGSIYLESFYAVINGVHTDVDLYTVQGYSYASGGIASFVISDHEMTPAYITNSYSEGKVFNAMRVGGIAGYISDYSSIANCYSTGELQANSDTNNPIAEYDAMAGGITAYAGVEAIISNSFSTAKVAASSVNGEDHEKTGGVIAGMAAATAINKSAVVYNCYSGTEAKITEASFINDTLKWSASDWTVTDGSIPVLSGKLPSSVPVKITADYGVELVDGKSKDVAEIQASGYYLPLIDHFRYSDTDLNGLVTADSKNNSYGYFFDADKKYAVPYGFVPTCDVTIYAGFADYSAVAGEESREYTFTNNGRTLVLTLFKSGEYIFTDGLNFGSSYVYDGSTIVFNDAPFARLSKIITDNQPELNYELYDFAAVLKGSELHVYDGTYFTDEKPLKFVSASSSATVDGFVGTWEKSASVNRVYTFESTGSNAGNWTYSEAGSRVSGGTYSINNGIARLLSGSSVYASARIAPSGLIQLALGQNFTDTDEFTEQNSEYFGYRGGLLGTWFDTDTGNYVVFNGYGSELAGGVTVNVGGNVSQLAYIKDGFFDGDYSQGYCLTLISSTTGALFGYLHYNPATNALTGMLYDANAGGFTQGHTFRLIDNFTGEWIGNGSVDGVDFSLLNFNGFGIYSVESSSGADLSSGYVEINGEIQRIEYSVDSTSGLTGKFTYKDVEYTVTFNEADGTVTVAAGNGSDKAELYRKDELYRYTLVTGATTYSFNGGGRIGAGILTVTRKVGTNTTVTEYTYSIESGSIEEKDLLVKTINKQTGEEGTITISNNYFLFKETPTAYGTTLAVKNSFVGDWAISRYFQPFSVGNFNLEGNATGKFQRDLDTGELYEATYSTISDTCILVSYYTGESTEAITSYIVLVDDDTLAISNYPYLISGGYVYAARQDELYGQWTNRGNSGVIQFDGLGYSKFSFGLAINLSTAENFYYTYRFGNYYMWIFNDESQMFAVEFLGRNPEGNDYYSSSMGNFRLVEFDAASTAVFTSKDGNYEFYLDGTVIIDGAIRSYELVNTDVNNATTTLIIKIDGEDDLTAEVNTVNGSVTIL